MSNKTPDGLLPFDYETGKAHPDRVVTRNRLPVKELTLFQTAHVVYPVYGVVSDAVHHWDLHGKWKCDEISDADLFLLPEARIRYVNVFPEGPVGNYSSLEAANKDNCSDRLGILRLTITGNRFNVDKVDEEGNVITDNE